MPENEVRALWILTETAIYLEERYYEEEKVKLLPQCMWLLAEHSKRHGDWEKVEEYSRRGVECLTRNGALPLLRELLELRIESLRNLGSDMCEIETLQNQLDSLVAVLARYADWVLRMDDLSKLHQVILKTFPTHDENSPDSSNGTTHTNHNPPTVPC